MVRGPAASVRTGLGGSTIGNIISNWAVDTGSYGRRAINCLNASRMPAAAARSRNLIASGSSSAKSKR